MNARDFHEQKKNSAIEQITAALASASAFKPGEIDELEIEELRTYLCAAESAINRAFRAAIRLKALMAMEDTHTHERGIAMDKQQMKCKIEKQIDSIIAAKEKLLEMPDEFFHYFTNICVIEDGEIAIRVAENTSTTTHAKIYDWLTTNGLAYPMCTSSAAVVYDSYEGGYSIRITGHDHAHLVWEQDQPKD